LKRLKFVFRDGLQGERHDDEVSLARPSGERRPVRGSIHC
jgi:hypothetical protein